MIRLSDDIHISLRPSRILAAGLCLAYLGASGCLLASEFPQSIRMSVMAFVAASGICDLIHFGIAKHGAAVRKLILRHDGDWSVVHGNGHVTRGRPRAPRLVHPWAVAFTLLLPDGRTLPVLVLPDMSDSDSFRALRVWLRLDKANPATAAGQR